MRTASFEHSFLLAQTVESAGTRETWVPSVGGEDGNGYTPVSLPGESYAQRSLAAAVHSVAESDPAEQLTQRKASVSVSLSL